jgi:hypothetical protein
MTITIDERIARLRASLGRLEQMGREDIARSDRPDLLLLPSFEMVLDRTWEIARLKHGYEGHTWRSPDWEALWRQEVFEHIAKGDPRDVAIYCAFGWYHGWSLVEPTTAATEG